MAACAPRSPAKREAERSLASARPVMGIASHTLSWVTPTVAAEPNCGKLSPISRKKHRGVRGNCFPYTKLDHFIAALALCSHGSGLASSFLR